MDQTSLIGTVGAAIILVFFVLNQTHKINQDESLYDVGNFIGASLLVVYAFLLDSLPFAVLNIIWAVMSLKDLTWKSKRPRSNFGENTDNGVKL